MRVSSAHEVGDMRKASLAKKPRTRGRAKERSHGHDEFQLQRSRSKTLPIKVVFATDYVRPRPILKRRSKSEGAMPALDAVLLPTILSSSPRNEGVGSHSPSLAQVALKTLSGGSNRSRGPDAVCLINSDDIPTLERRGDRRRVTFGEPNFKYFEVDKPGLRSPGDFVQDLKRRRPRSATVG